MTSTDFDTILIESVNHQTIVSFFENKRKAHKCNKKEFVDGLTSSFNRLRKVLCEPHRYYVNDDGLIEVPFHPHGTIDNSIDFEIGFNLDFKGMTITIWVTNDMMPDLQNRLDNYFRYIAEKEGRKSQNKKDSLVPDNQKLSNHEELFKALSKNYISGINLSEFTNIINYHVLSPGTPKAKWNGKKVEAYDFSKHIGLGIKKWNECFELPKGGKLSANNKDKNGMPSSIVEILKIHYNH